MYDFVYGSNMTQLLLKTKTAGYYFVQNDNQLLYSKAFNTDVWVCASVTLTSGQTDPNSGTEAFTLTATGANATMLQSIALSGGSLTRTFSVYLKRKTGTGNISITVDGATYSVETTTGSWARFDTSLAASGTVTAGIKITTSGDEVYAAWAQLEDGDTATTYATNTTSRFSLTSISDTDYPANTARGAAFLNGYFFVMEPSGDIYNSDLENAASWPGDFIGSQIEPDQGQYLAKYKEYLVALKSWATEFYYYAANAVGSPLSPVPNGAFKVGCASEDSVKEMAGTLVWMGQTRDGFGRGIFRLNGTNPEKISSASVDKILNQDNLSTVYSWTANVGSHMLYGLTLVTSAVTLVYDFSSSLWSFFTYLVSSGVTKTITAVSTAGVVTSTAHGYSDGDIVLVASTNSSWNGWHVVTAVSANEFTIQGGSGTAFSGSGTSVKHTESYFPISASTAANGTQYMQHATSGALYELSQSNLSDAIGSIAARVRTPKFDSDNAKFKYMTKLDVVGDKVASTACVRYTDNDFSTYSSFRPVDLSVERSQLRRLGNFTRRSFEILHVKGTLLRLEALEIEGA